MSVDGKKSQPVGWDRATIGGLVGSDGVFIDGDWVESKDQDPNGDVRLIQLADVGDGRYQNRSSRFLTSKKAAKLRCTFLKDGDVLVARMPDPLGRACIFPGDSKKAVTVVDVCIVRTGEIGANHRWLAWAINSPAFRSAVAALQSGSTRKRISRGNLSTLFLPIPPLAEQIRISDEIEKQFTRLDAAVAALKRVQSNLKRYRAAVLKAACEGRLVPTEAELARRKPHSGANKPSSDTIPEGWKWVTLSELSEIQGGIQKQPSRRPVKNTYPFLRVANVLRGRLDLHEMHSVELFNGELEKLKLQKDDLLIVEGNGSPSQIGRMAIWKGEIENCVHQNHIIRARLTPGALPAYVQAYWNSPRGSSTVLEVASSTSGLYTLSVSKVGRIPIPLPPVSEQARIVEEIDRRLSSIEEIECEVDCDLKRAERLRQAILKCAFKGKLVPQDPNDESASVLLERIRGTAILARPELRRGCAPGFRVRRNK